MRGVPKGRWWRFPRYQIREIPTEALLGSESSLYLVPAPGAELMEYDPWRATASARAPKLPPYLELVEAVRSAPSDLTVHASGWDTPDLRRGVGRWCNRYGLLGLLPHDCTSARLGEWKATRGPKGWERESALWDPEREPFAEVLLAGEVWYADGWYQYFPEVPKADWERDRPEEPLTPDFWAAYREPLSGFVGAARAFANAIEVIASGSPVVEGRRDTLDREAALERLTWLASGVQIALAQGKGKRIAQTWRAPSLLAHLAMQAIQDLTGDRRPVQCPCGMIFQSSHRVGKYCSPRCGNRERVRRHRREKAKTRN